MNDCIFCRIVKGEIPCTKLYEDDYTLAFLDIAPINYGHSLVIHKEHTVSFSSLSFEQHQQVMSTLHKVSCAITKLKEFDGFNIHQSNGECAGQVVPHTHFHIIPRKNDDNFSWNWRTLQYQENQQKDLQEQIIAKIKQ